MQDLLESVPYFFIEGLIPPLAVVNETLRRGRVDAGMSGACEWTPFELAADEYRELVEALLTTPGRAYRQVAPAEAARITSYDGWLAWVTGVLRRERALGRGG